MRSSSGSTIGSSPLSRLHCPRAPGRSLQEQLKDEFVEDPVARIRFPKYLASSTLERDGRTYYFVDEETRREFEKQPAATVTREADIHGHNDSVRESE